MKNRKLIAIFTLAALTAVLQLFTSCYEPSPLYGTWSDGSGNKVSLYSDDSYKAVIVDSTGESYDYEGTYEVYTNVICFTKSDSTIVTTEWDIRGSILYLTWPVTSDTTAQLTLFKTGN